ncbi:MAG: SDR family NAD(P)-dependent oxidoreductase [Pseudonocardiaceae bacterium]
MDISRHTPQDFPRTAIVTGSDSGIGRATAVALAEMGCDVGVTWHTDEHGAQATAEEVRATGRRAEVRRLDLTNLPDAADVIDEFADLLGGVDVLVNNAGTGTATALLDIDYNTWREVFATDVDGAFLSLRRDAPDGPHDRFASPDRGLAPAIVKTFGTVHSSGQRAPRSLESPPHRGQPRASMREDLRVLSIPPGAE